MVRFSVVTPCLNPGHLLRETVESIVGQRALGTGGAELEYIISDGGSTDGTVEYLETLDDPRVRWFSGPDEGMYDGLARGLTLVSGDVVSYLNAGDLYHPNAFDVVAETIFHTDGWITGMRVTLNERGDVVGANVPHRFRREFFECGLYGTRLPFLQQESTFWTANLNETIDLDRLAGFLLAGDSFIWTQLARSVDLTVIAAFLGAWREHRGQLSEDLDGYRREMLEFTRRPKLLERGQASLDSLVGHAPMVVRRMVSDGRIIEWKRRQGWVVRRSFEDDRPFPMES